MKTFFISWMLLSSTAAWAVMPSTNDSMSVDANKIKAAQHSCDSFCNELMNSEGQILGLDGGVGWKDEKDDQWCADHGSPTNVAVGPKPGASPKPSANCNIPLAEGENCIATNKKILHCKWHNSQAEQQCQAYLASKDAGTKDYVVLGIDLAATAVCGGACAASAMGGGMAGLEQVCSASTLVASSSEFIEVMTIETSPLSKTIKGTLAAAGMGASAISLYKGGVLNKDADPNFYSSSSSGSKDMSSGGKVSCASAAALAVVSGLRYKSINDLDKTKDNACKAVEKLASSANVMSPNGQADQNYNTAPPSQNSGSSVATAGGSAGGLSGSAFQSSGMLQSLNCIQGNGIAGCMPAQAASTDGKLLSDSGLDKFVMNNPQYVDPKDVLKEMKSKAGAGEVLRRTLGEGSGEVGKSLAALAQAAQDNASQVTALLKGNFGTMLAAEGTAVGGMSNGGGGGKGSKGAGGHSDQGIFGMFGAKSPGLSGGPAEAGFNKESRSPASFGEGDIWHSDTKGSIFQIVSEKIGSSRDRVDKLEWVLPLNRAILGLPNRPSKVSNLEEYKDLRRSIR